MTDTTQEQLPTKKEITAKEFIKIWEGEYRGIEGYTHYYIDNGAKVLFRGHTIVDEVNINDSVLLDIEFTNVDFEKSVFVTDCVLKDLRAISSSFRFFYLTGGKNEHLSVSFNETTMLGLYTTNTNVDRIELYKVQLTQIHCVNSIISYFQVLECSIKAVSINGSTFDHFDIEESLSGDIHIISSKITDELFLTKKSIVGNINIDNTFISKLWFFENVMTPHIHIKDSTVVKSYFSKNVTIGKLIIENLHDDSRTFELFSSIINELQIDTDNSYKILITGQLKSRSIIHTLNLSHTVFPKDFYLNISYTDINYILFESFINNGRIVFNDIRPLAKFERFILSEKFRYTKREQNGEYIFEDVENEPSIDISNSDLGNTQFIGCDLDLFTDFTFDNSKILSVFIADSILPNRKNINRDIKDDFEQRKLVLSQFKKIYESQGDVVRATEYRAEEMEVYRQYLWHNRDADNRWIELINLSFNRFSSYYGSNWFRAACVTLTLTWSFFTLYCFSLGYRFGNDWNEFFKLISYSFEFLNPIRKNSTLVPESDITPLARTIDYVGRVFIAYCVYQTIQAFRKFGKSSS